MLTIEDEAIIRKASKQNHTMLYVGVFLLLLYSCDAASERRLKRIEQAVQRIEARQSMVITAGTGAND